MTKIDTVAYHNLHERRLNLALFTQLLTDIISIVLRPDFEI